MKNYNNKINILVFTNQILDKKIKISIINTIKVTIQSLRCFGFIYLLEVNLKGKYSIVYLMLIKNVINL